MILKKILAGAVASSITMTAVFFPVKSNVSYFKQTEFTVNAADSKTSGSCGENVTWTLFDEGIVAVSGTGEMANYSDSISPFWDNNKIKSVIIEDGVTSIGSHAFERCASLETVIIGKGVRSINDYSFFKCSGLKNVIFSDGLKSIGKYAFRACDSLKEVVLPESVGFVGQGAFCNCRYLASVVFKNADCWIDGYDDTICNDYDFLEYYGVFGGTIYGYNESTAKKYADSNGLNFKSLDEYQEPATEPIIITTPVTTTTITTTTTTTTTTTVITTTTEAATTTRLSTIQITDSESNTANIRYKILEDKTVEVEGADTDSSIREIVIPPEIDGLSVTKIKNRAFDTEYDKVESVTLPDSIVSIGNGAFKYCKSLKEINIPDGVTSIGDNAFSFCYDLESIIIPDSVTYIGSTAFYCCYSLKEVRLSNNITELGSRLFESCVGLEYVIIPDSVKVIGPFAFQQCKKLEEIIIRKNNIESIGFEAFEDTPWLENKRYLKDMVILGTLLIDGKKCQGGVSIPDGVTVLCEGAFSSNLNIYSIKVPASVIKIEEYALDGVTSPVITIENPDCEIFDSEYTISKDSFFDSSKLIIRGYKNSTAEAYAQKYGCEFEPLTENDSPTTTVSAEGTSSTTTAAVAQPEHTEYKSGDTDGDGEITLKDTVLIRRYIAGGWNIEIDKKAADIDGDGEITLKDAVLIRRYIAGGWNVEIK